MAALTYFTATGTYFAALHDSVYDVDNDPELTPMSGTVTFTPLIDAGDSLPVPTLTPPANLWLVPIKAQIKSGVITCNGVAGIKLVANTAVLALEGDLFYRVDFYDGLAAGGKTYFPDSFTFQAPTSATTVDLVTVTPVAGQPAQGAGGGAVTSVAGRTGAIIISSADINDASTIGKSLLTAADQAAVQTIVGSVAPADGSITFPKLAPAAVVTASETIAANLNDATIPTSAAVQAAITAAVTALLNGAPGALDTLKELADAINDDASFAATVTTALATKTANLVPTAVKTSAYTAAVNDLVPADATSAAFAVTLPTAPADKSRIAVKKIDSSANTVTVALGGSDVFNKSAGSTSLTLTLQNQAVVLQYKASGAIWYVVSTDAPIAGLQRLLGTQNRGNVAIWFGDSIGTAQDMIVGSANLVDHTIRSESTFAWASILSGQRLRYFRNASKGGDNAATAMARWDADVAPYNFSVLVWALGTNDSFLQTTVAAYAAQVKEAHARTRAKGADFIICTIPPNDNLSNNPANRKSLIVQYNQFLRDYAAKWGLILIDMFDLLSDTSGNYISGYSTDKTHPIAAGYRVMGQLVADTLALYLPPFSAPLPRTTTDANLLTEPLFLGGLNGSFVPTGWSMPSGVLRTGVTASLVTSDTDIKGNWYKMVVANTFSGPQTIFQTISSGITAGRQYRFLGRIKLLNPVGITVTARIAYDANFDYTGDATNTHEFRAMSGLGGAIPSGVFWFDSVAPTSASTAQINIQIVGNGGTGEVHLAQIGVYDITDVQAAL